MATIEQIQDLLRQLPTDKQSEVLDFISFLQQQVASKPGNPRKAALREHPAFGSWRVRNIESLSYQHQLRAEWDERA